MIVSYERGISMKQLSELLETVLHDRDITPDAVPALDLYMDQVLTLFNEGLQENKRHPEDKLLTKTMINNYSKEKILLPVKGKKYTRQHIIQMLCIYQLKQMLSLAVVKALDAMMWTLKPASTVFWRAKIICATPSPSV